jgi:integrase
VFRFVRSVFAWAVADKRIQTSPFSIMVKAPKTSTREGRPTHVDQATALVASAPHRYSAVITVQAGLGLRAGEVCGLRVEDVDFLRREVHVQRQLTDEGVVEALPKADISS